jgi:hypothetical protein
VGVLVGALVVDVAEADGPGEGLDLGLVAGEEVPAGGGAFAAVVADVLGLLFGGERGSFFRVDADGDDLELLAGAELERLERLGHAVERHRAQAGAAVVDQGEDDGLFAEVVGEADGVALLVAEGEVEGDLAAELLVDAYAVDDRRRGGGLGGGAGAARGGEAREGGEAERQR